MGFVYANTGSGPNADRIGWYDFGADFTLAPGQVASLSGTLDNGITVSFDIQLNLAGGNPRNFAAVPAPIPGAYFGQAGYTGLTGCPILFGNTGVSNNLSSLAFSNIVVKNALGSPITNYTMVVADGENTSGDVINQEGLSFVTDGGNWVTLATLGNTNPPRFIGGGTFVGLIGEDLAPNAAYALSTQSPTQVSIGLSAPIDTDRNGIAIGFAVIPTEPDHDLPPVDTSAESVADAQENNTGLYLVKIADKRTACLGDTITYQVAMQNIGTVPAYNLAITDPIPAGTALDPDSLTVNVPYSGLPGGTIRLTNPVVRGEMVLICFKVLVTDIPNPNPMVSQATASFTRTADPADPNGTVETAASNPFTITVSHNNLTR